MNSWWSTQFLTGTFEKRPSLLLQVWLTIILMDVQVSVDKGKIERKKNKLVPVIADLRKLSEKIMVSMLSLITIELVRNRVKMSFLFISYMYIKNGYKKRKNGRKTNRKFGTTSYLRYEF